MIPGLNVLSIVAAVGITLILNGMIGMTMGQAPTELPDCKSYVSGSHQCTGLNGTCALYPYYGTNTVSSYKNAINVTMLGATGIDRQGSQVNQCIQKEPFTYSLECTPVGP